MPLTIIFESFNTAFSLILSVKWAYLPVVLFVLAYSAVANYTNLKYRLGLKWSLLEIRVPKEVHKSPKAMEQVFAGLHGIYSAPVRWSDKFFKGKMSDWYSFEMIGKGGETHFYVRALEKYRNVVESQIYAQYPEAEIYEVPDYINDLPMSLPDDKYDLWGAELMLAKDDIYPIRTYLEFEEKSAGKDDVKRIDPLASLSELFSTLHVGEQIWVQILGAPTGDSWVKKGQAALDKIMGKETPAVTGGGILSDMIFAADRAIGGGSSAPIEKKEEKRRDLSPGKQEIMKAMEKSWERPGYSTAIRYLYIGPRDAFRQASVYGVSGAFRQFSSQNLNSFKGNKFTVTYAKGLFKASKLLKRKKSIYNAFRERTLFSPKTARYVLTTEELATICHFPDVGVRSPLLPRVEAKKGEPPVGLPMI